LSFDEYWKAGDPIGPTDLLRLTGVCASLYPALQRVGEWAVASYGPHSDSEEAKTTRKRLEAEAGL
jgi:hypothetical protein